MDQTLKYSFRCTLWPTRTTQWG